MAQLIMYLHKNYYAALPKHAIREDCGDFIIHVNDLYRQVIFSIEGRVGYKEPEFIILDEDYDIKPFYDDYGLIAPPREMFRNMSDSDYLHHHTYR